MRPEKTPGRQWQAVSRRARVIVAAALIMMSVFGSFVLNDDPTVKQFGVGLSVGVALAAMTVLLLAPALLVLAGAGSCGFQAGSNALSRTSTSKALPPARLGPRFRRSARAGGAVDLELLDSRVDVDGPVGEVLDHEDAVLDERVPCISSPTSSALTPSQIDIEPSLPAHVPPMMKSPRSI